MKKVTDCKQTYWEEAIKQYFRIQEWKRKKA